MWRAALTSALLVLLVLAAPTVSQAQDYDYLEGKRIVSLEEAIGVREVSSKSVPAGPTSG